MIVDGVISGGSYELFGVDMARWPLEPAPEILEQIANLPPNSTVGVEMAEEAVDGSDLQGLEFAEEDLNYWGIIIDECKRRGQDVAYLDSLSLQLEASRYRRNFDAVMEAQLGLSNYSVVEGEESAVEELRFAMSVGADFTQIVKREDEILRRLRLYRPQLAIIAQAHGDFLMLDDDLVAELGVTEYWHGDVDIEEELMLSDLPRLADTPREQQLVRGEPDRKLVLERERATRQYNAVTVGRITLNTSPLMIGSWDLRLRPEGLFEVHVGQREGETLSGEIEDSLGTALFSGSITDTALKIFKEYDPRRTLVDNYIEGRIVHEAEAQPDGSYVGIWYSEEKPRLSGEIEVRGGDKLYDPPLSAELLEMIVRSA